MLGKALEIAKNAHKGQVDKAGEPYIMHPITVACSMDTFDGVIVALLHDVVEDSGYTFEDLERYGFSDEIISALKLLTHEKGVPYMEYIKQVKGNDLARKVKMADLSHNMDLSRLPKITEKDEKRLEKYKAALEFLKE